MPTFSPFLPPSKLAIPPDLHDCRPLCPCGAIPKPGFVGMHGDGLTERLVPWPSVGDDGISFNWVLAVGRRYWCPICATTVRVAHAGLRPGATYSAAAILAVLLVIASPPVGAGQTEVHAHELVRGCRLPVSERARTGQPRWTSVRRWVRDLEQMWPCRVLPNTHWRTRMQAFLVSFGLGVTVTEVIDAAVSAHVLGGVAM